MTNTQLKTFAIISMLIDHTGAVLFPEMLILRIIGRLAFPIFAFLLVEGYFHTRDVQKYLTRLSIFAILSEVPFDLAFYGTVWHFEHQNIFFTLFLGLWGIYFIDKFKDTQPKKGQLLFWGLALISILLFTDYIIFGMLTVYFFHRYRDQKVRAMLNVSAVHILLGMLGSGLFGGTFNAGIFIQVLATLSMVLIGFYNGEKGRSMKYVFYAFYPVHLLLLWGIHTFTLYLL